ncbi:MULTISPECIES: serine hydrolase domain-containing protein [Variovorax]|jgi:CubicO group peptidase (beta-lactamase class C family)|uniref:serine hydrolase domain-containing protein n=1 Tax=Variovorax TaxID=34072 RepID=UPI00086F25B1|nr:MULTISPECIES: serine hydrolase [Variovorax]MBN8753194.1 serine hydrolase [Variovorax sp.]ODU11529.1 MAG: 6-aminohexanoate hydrolase [Variovorax sp. SCN 67-85]ODV15106.1 MAG: 6-aminohexanoate hydrolase [Variovorax sp. SCN 67-20]OJZ11993.1 MAG: 6-aminohexanoate hydrolase [Variovorax sp. 67-131]UKI05395.1 beta-lactamase family protein [Variovorax paradoxus]
MIQDNTALAAGWRDGFPTAGAAVQRPRERPVFEFPHSRWAFSHLRELQPTRNVPRGNGPVSVLPRAERPELDELRFTLPADGSQTDWRTALETIHADGAVVLHRGRIVYERYFGALDEHGQHMAMSVTKSVVGTVGAMLAADGTLDEHAAVTRYIPELAASAFGQATVRQVMDMTTGIDYSEEYANPDAGVWKHARAGELLPRPAGYAGAEGYRQFLQTVQGQGTHGEAFAYRTVNTDVLGWLISRATGHPVAKVLSELIWSRIGAEQDASFALDGQGAEFAGGGLCTGLRDLARLGETMRLGGFFNGAQIVPEAVVADIRNGADPARFALAGYTRLAGWSYRNMWWVAHDAHRTFTAQGIHGQALHIDPTAEMVVARFASHPLAANAHLPTSMPAFRALAEHLMRHGG